MSHYLETEIETLKKLISPGRLSCLAEMLGEPAELLTTDVTNFLLALTHHDSPMVREGAIYGLAKRLSSRVIAHLREMSTNDPSSGVREAAREVVEENL